MKTLALVSFVALITTSGLALAGDPPSKAAAPAPMAAPPAEIAALGKAVGGTWKCKGSVHGDDGKAQPMEATIKAASEGFWVTETMEAKSGPMNYKMQAFTTWDAGAKKWRRVTTDSFGGYMTGSADTMGKDGKVTYAMDGWSPRGTTMFKDEVDTSDMKKGVKMSGKMSSDKGKTWMAVYEMTCTK
jgi:hypothetical protein